jgi:hypothetical protein
MSTKHKDLVDLAVVEKRFLDGLPIAYVEELSRRDEHQAATVVQPQQRLQEEVDVAARQARHLQAESRGVVAREQLVLGREVAGRDLVLARHRRVRQLYRDLVDVQAEAPRALTDRAKQDSASNPGVENRRRTGLADSVRHQLGDRSRVKN